MDTQLKWTNYGVVALASVLLAVAPGCGGYGEVSPQAYEYAKAIYNVTNRKAEDRLAKLSKQIDASRQAEEISTTEADWLRDILKQAGDGNWKKANKQARAMMEDQVQPTAG